MNIIVFGVLLEIREELESKQCASCEAPVESSKTHSEKVFFNIYFPKLKLKCVSMLQTVHHI